MYPQNPLLHNRPHNLMIFDIFETNFRTIHAY